jgi:hypothetical protein
MTTQDSKTTNATPSDATRAQVPWFTNDEFKNARWACDGALEFATDQLVQLRRAALLLMPATSGITFMPTMDDLDRFAGTLGAAMLACKRADDAEARYDEMCKEVDACRATPIKAAD